jgi:hypothetical protein
MPWGRTGAADRRNPGDNNGQQETTNLEVSGRFATMYLGRVCPGLRFHTAEVTGSIPVTPTSTNGFLSFLARPGCQQIASKSPGVGAKTL